MDIDLKELRNVAEGADHLSDAAMRLYDILTPTIVLALLDRLERAEADARRYRVLRDGPDGIVAPFTFWESGCKPEELDAALDALAASKKED